MELFDENGNRKYSPETIMSAYKNLNWYKEDKGEYIFPNGDDFWVRFRTAKENWEHLLNNLFSNIYLIHSFALEGKDDAELAGFSFYDNEVGIEYYCKNENSQFDVMVYYSASDNKWYCRYIGILVYETPVCINNFPNGYSIENFERKTITENGNHYIKVYNSAV